MASAENAKLQLETGQTATAMSALTNSGDAQIYTSAAALFSRKSGYAPDVRPNGLITGGAVIPAVSLGNDKVDVSALSCYLAGVKTAVGAGVDTTITRPATNVSKVNSITINSSGAIAVVAGTDGSTTAFSETRAAAGGPPLIPVGSIEIAQVRVTASAAAPITAAQIYATVGSHVERYDYPLFTINYETGKVTFDSALPLIHTGTIPKGVYASYAAPTFSDVRLASDFKPAETAHSLTSKAVYGNTIGSSSSSLGQAGFTAYLDDGLSDNIVALKNEILWFKFFPDRYKTGYMLTQGKLGIARTFPAGDSVQAACTVSSETASIEVNV